MSAGEKIELRAIADELRAVFGRKKSGGRNERTAIRCARKIEEIIGGATT